MPVFGSGEDCIVFADSELERTFPLANREFSSYLHHFAEMLDFRLNESMRLGDRVQGSFNHAFKKWTGLTPRPFRSKE